ncbi:MAG: hypothetical protein IPJ74_19675 [Saprospiraceae bacterium]|nr:hypothetical protein [Saprospiraceae bacterium]
MENASANAIINNKIGTGIGAGALVGIISSKARKAKTGDTEAELKKIAPFGRISLLVGLAIVILAVLIFH